MNFLGIGKIIDSVGKIADDLTTSKEEKLQIALKEKAMEVGLMQGQIEINKEEARHGSIFVAGWRPFIGWVGGLALAYQFLIYPLLVWAWSLLQAYQVIPCVDPELAKHIADVVQVTKDNVGCTVEPPPTLPSGALFSIVTGMLGIGGMRSYDKLKNTNTHVVGAKPK